MEFKDISKLNIQKKMWKIRMINMTMEIEVKSDGTLIY